MVVMLFTVHFFAVFLSQAMLLLCFLHGCPARTPHALLHGCMCFLRVLHLLTVFPLPQVRAWRRPCGHRDVSESVKMTLLAGDGSDYDYSALSCASETSLNPPPHQEEEAQKGCFYKRAQPLPQLAPDGAPLSGKRKLHAIINVGGLRYQLPWTTLEDFPLSRLGQLRLCSSFDEIMRVCDDYDVTHNEFFFDRSPCAFRTILTYLRAGKLRSLREMCALSFREELLYWGVPEESLEWCCRRRLLQRVEEFEAMERAQEEEELLEDLLDSEGGRRERAGESRVGKCMSKLRDMVERPQSGLPGKIFACLSVLFVTITAINLSISTLPAMREEEETVSGRFIQKIIYSPNLLLKLHVIKAVRSVVWPTVAAPL